MSEGQNPNPIERTADPEAWYSSRRAEFEDALAAIGLKSATTIEILSGLYESDLQRLAPDPNARLASETAEWLRLDRAAFVLQTMWEAVGNVEEGDP